MYAAWRLLAAFLLLLAVSLARSQDSSSRALIYAPQVERAENPPPHISATAHDPGELPPKLPVGTAPIRRPVSPGPIGFQNIVQPAGIIFSGTVVSVAKSPAKSPASTTVTFKVESAVRGVSTGETLTIREWAGLWDRGERYRVGERVFLFLYSPSKLGLTSPVAGLLGRFPIALNGKVQFGSQHLPLLAADPILGGKREASISDLALALQRYARLD